MSDQTWLQSLKVGDEVLLCHSVRNYLPLDEQYRICKVERATQTTVTVDGEKYTRRRGVQVGSVGSYYKPWIEEPTEKRLREIEEHKAERQEEIDRDQLYQRVRGISHNSLTLDQLRRIVAILDEPTPDPQEASRT